MHTRATGRRSSSPVPAPRQTPGAGRAAFAVPAARQPAEPPDYDAWLHNAEAFGHHIADLPAPASPPVQRKPGEDASPYALPAGLSMNALRTSSGPEPIQLVTDPEAIREAARANSNRLSGHGRQAHGRKGRARPAAQVARNAAKSLRKAEERTVAAAVNREKKQEKKNQ